MKTKRTRSQYGIILLLQIFFALVTAYYSYTEGKIEETEPNLDFLNYKKEYFDSIVSNKPIEYLVDQLIILKIDNSDTAFFYRSDFVNSGGVIYNADSIRQHFSFHKSVDFYGENIPINFLFSSNGFPGNIRDIPAFPNGLCLEAITSDSTSPLLSSLISDISNIAGYEFCLLPPVGRKLYNPVIYRRDSLLIRKLAKKYKVGVPCIYSPDTITDLSSLLAKYKSLIDASAISFYIDQNTYIRSQNQENKTKLSSCLRDSLYFQGILISRYKKNIDKVFVPKNYEWTNLIIADYKDRTEVKDSLVSYYSSSDEMMESLRNKARMILQLKSYMRQVADTNSTEEAINILQSVNTKKIARSLFKSGLTVVNNDSSLIPISILDSMKVITFGNPFSEFVSTISDFTDLEQKKCKTIASLKSELKKSTQNGTTILALSTKSLKQDEVEEIGSFIKEMRTEKLIVILFGDINHLAFFDSIPSLIHSYNDQQENQKFAAEIALGGITSHGRIPIEISEKLKAGKGCSVKKTRLCYSPAYEAGLSDSCFIKIRQIVSEGIESHAFPGCQVFIAKDGKIVYDEAFGYQTYERKIRIQKNHLYDIASLTKIAGTTVAAMKLISDGRLKIQDTISKFFKDTKIEYTRIKPDTTILIDSIAAKDIEKFKKIISKRDTVWINDSMLIAYDTIIYKVTPRANIFKRTVKDLLSHMSGLPPAMPVLRYILWNQDTMLGISDSAFLSTLNGKKPLRKDTLNQLFNKYFADHFIKDTAERELAKGMYLRKTYADTFWTDTKQIRVYDKSVYMYSDANMNVLKAAIDSLLGKDMADFLYQEIYNPLGLDNIMYQPLKRKSQNEIAPTADERYFRRQLLQGYVHDEAAAIAGGKAGNAGIFSNAHDLGVLGQMLLNGGTYGGKRYLSQSVVQQFTETNPENGRGLGFDKAGPEGIVAKSAPPSTYGHTGFTGTCMWIDPENDIVFVFLSNRVYPSVKNWTINTRKIRQRIHQTIYDDLENSKKNQLPTAF